MSRMSPAASTPTDAEHKAEVEKQEEIAAEVAAAEAESAPAPEVEEVPLVKLGSVNVDEYPLSVSAVGLDEELVFDNSSSTVEVTPEVAEQVTYLPTVEVIA